ncbi:MAG: hypothetical protein WKF78_10635 [Candidatus Limnocylindrales bacterium]
MTSNAISTTTEGSTWRYRPNWAIVCASNQRVISGDLGIGQAAVGLADR